MKTDDYVELHAASAFSFLRGASRPKVLAREAARLGLPALALLDRDGVYGAPQLHGAARETGLRAIVGAEVTMEDGSVVPLLVANQDGYRNLCQLISTAKLEARSPGVLAARRADPLTPEWAHLDPAARKRPCFATWEELARHNAGLIALTGDEDGPLRRGYAGAGADGAAEGVARLRRIFGTERLYVELQRHRVRGEEPALQVALRLAEAHGLPVVATGGVLHATRGERPITDVFTCLRHHTTLDAAGRRLTPNGERRLRGAAEMRALFADRPEAVTNSRRLAERLEFSLQKLGYEFPSFPVGAGETMESCLRAETYAGASERIGSITPAIRAQLEKELALIAELKFSGYFLIVWDICKWCRDHRILIQGRGSAANSAVCFALGITAVNPLHHRLLFERFLSRGRVGADGHPSWPDIDLDLPSGERREAVIQEVYQRYAPRGAAMVANVISYRGRSTAREVGKVLGFTEDIADRFSSLYANGDFPHTLELEKQLRLAGLPAEHPRLRAMAVLYERMRELPRHLGQHSGGMVLCPGRLDGVVPIEPASMPGRTVVQWDKDDCEDLGLVKIDFLGLGMMAVLQESLELCAEHGGPASLEAIPEDDPKTYAMMRRADTIGVFQIESRAQMATLPRLLPEKFYDLAIEVAIVRPGPITGRLVHPIIQRRAERRRNPEAKFEAIDPSVDAIIGPVLDRTYGVILFQEQMLEVAMTLAAFDGAEAEELRRALGFHRNTERLEKVTAKLRAALRAHGHAETVVEKVVQSAVSFAAYGFPESHAISFAKLAYASTWLKTHRPAEFYAGLLNNQPMGFYSPATLVQDGRRHGLRVRPTCVNASDWPCTVEPDGAMRIGLSYVRGVSEAAVRGMLAARAERGFASLDDFLGRTTFPAAERRALAAVGALNVFAGHRRAALWQVEAAWSDEEPLLRLLKMEGGEVPLALMTAVERLNADFAGTTLTVGAHPMSLMRERLPDVWRASDLPLGRDGERVIIGGSVICRQRPGTAKGVVFVSLEDETGIANAIVSPEVFERRRLVINESPALRIGGRLQHQSGVIHVRAETIEPLRLAELPVQASHDFR